MKIYIPYIITVFIYFISPFQFNEYDGFAAFLSHVFLYKMFVPKYMSTFGVFWFVSTLFQFYILFYALCWFRDRFSRWQYFWGACVGIGLVWQISVFIKYGNTFIRVLNGSALQYLPVFALGMVIAELLYTEQIDSSFFTARRTGIMAVSFLTMDIFMVLGPIEWMGAFNDIPDTIGFISLLMFLYCLSTRTIKHIFISISDFGFEWYLVHILIMTLVFTVVGKTTVMYTLLSAFVSIIGSLFIAFLYHKMWSHIFKIIKL